MPQHKSNWKRMRTSAKQRTRNRAGRSSVRMAIRELREGNAPERPARLPVTVSAIDNGVRLGVIKKATANRLKSRLARFINKSSQPSQPGA